jgi:hypothetical protein
MDVQQSKKDLARVILSPHDSGRMDDSLERLQVYTFFSPSSTFRMILIVGVCVEIAVSTIDLGEGRLGIVRYPEDGSSSSPHSIPP